MVFLDCAISKGGIIKIVFVITGLSTGGAEVMLLKVLRRLDARFSPFVISLGTVGEIGLLIQKQGIPVEAIGMRPGRLNLIAFYRLVRRLRAIKPEVVHTWMYHADLLGGVAARLAGIGAVGWCVRHSNLDQTKSKLLTRIVMRICARISHWIPDRILCCSEVARQIHVDCGYAKEKMLVVPNGFDLDCFRPNALARAALRSELKVPSDALLVGLIGRFDPQKNHAGFIKAAGFVRRRISRSNFVLAGSGVDGRNKELKMAMDSADIKGATHLLGLRDDVPRLMAALDVLVSFSSYGEAFSNVLGEAMACGIPCVATDIGDSAYIVGNTGRVISSENVDDLVAALEFLLLMPEAERQALGERARTRVNENFEIGQVVKRYESFYEELAFIGLKGCMDIK